MLIVYHIPQKYSIFNWWVNIRIVQLERQLQVRAFKKKFFDKETQKFITIEEICYKEEAEIKEFDSFVDFYMYLETDLSDANLHDYDFKGVNLADFNTDGAYINSSVLIEQGLYNDSFYNANIRDYVGFSELMVSAENEVIEAVSVLHDTDLFAIATLNDTSHKMYYISDIHLNHKLLQAFPSNATELEVRMYIRQLVKKMIDSATDRSNNDYLLVMGDISFNFEISVLFYTELVIQWERSQRMAELFGHWLDSRRIIVVLGNHELWDFNKQGVSQTQMPTLDEIIEQYRNLFSRLGICFLQNDLLLANGAIISEEQLKPLTPDELKYVCLKSPYVILGGLGFSGLCQAFNATHGIYRNTIPSLEEDLKQTKRFAYIYDKVKSILGNDNVVVLTHTPKENWSNDNYQGNWIYVNGHTHRNDYCCSPEKTFYSDNQIGYHSASIGLKHFLLPGIYDVFRYYPNGIHIVSRGQYLDFNRGVRIILTFNRTGKVYMLKNSGVYCFMYENPSSGKKFLLSGGAISKLEHNDLNYYFERMVFYAEAIKGLLGVYHKALKSIADSIKRIGGEGKVHGCIVDIDVFNHIYVNPRDGTVTPYCADSMVNKYVYQTVGELLSAQRKDLYDNYMKLLDEEHEGVKLLEGEAEAGSLGKARLVLDTYIYIPSRIMKSLQYLTEVNVIRIWNNRIMDIQSEIKLLEE
jgi:calcineurin-like phosphoesterase family protein